MRATFDEEFEQRAFDTWLRENTVRLVSLDQATGIQHILRAFDRWVLARGMDRITDPVSGRWRYFRMPAKQGLATMLKARGYVRGLAYGPGGTYDQTCYSLAMREPSQEI